MTKLIEDGDEFAIKILLALASLDGKVKFVDHKEALEYLERSKIISQEIYGLDHFDPVLFNSQTITSFSAGYIDVEIALRDLENGLRKSQELGNQEYEFGYLINIGRLYLEEGNLISALAYFEKCLTISKEIGFRLGESNAYEGLGTIAHKHGNRAKTLYYWESSLEIVQDIDGENKSILLLNNIGKIYEELSDTTQALFYYEKSLERNHENQLLKCTTLHNIGGIYLALGNYDKALVKLIQGLSIVEEFDRPILEWTIRLDISNAYCGKNDYYEAIRYLQKNLEISTAINDISKSVLIQMQIGSIYFESLKEFEKSIYYFLQANINIERAVLHNKNLHPMNGLIRIAEHIGEDRFEQIVRFIQKQ
ncbi:MAG: tetratricopeptide repeat protein [Flavobacterium sp.]|nr:MAG: tetratricopeptide repeat protein [Flavobacterium sp.]